MFINSWKAWVVIYCNINWHSQVWWQLLCQGCFDENTEQNAFRKGSANDDCQHILRLLHFITYMLKAEQYVQSTIYIYCMIYYTISDTTWLLECACISWWSHNGSLNDEFCCPAFLTTWLWGIAAVDKMQDAAIKWLHPVTGGSAEFQQQTSISRKSWSVAHSSGCCCNTDMKNLIQADNQISVMWKHCSCAGIVVVDNTWQR